MKKLIKNIIARDVREAELAVKILDEKEHRKVYSYYIRKINRLKKFV